MEDSPDNQSNSMSDSKKSTGRLTDGTDSCTTASISSSNCSGAKTLIVYENDESIEIKEEIIEERHQDGEHHLLSERSRLDEKPISSANKFAVKTAIVYEHDETLDIKEEIIQDTGAVTAQKLNKKCESRLNTVDTRQSDILSADQLRTHKKKKIHESEPEPLKKYNCRKCARSYKLKRSLYAHQKFVCRVTPQFICNFCHKRFPHKSSMSRHVVQVHQKTEPNISHASYNCDKCCKSYASLPGLRYHILVNHAAVKPQFICDVCGHKTNKKSFLSRHMSSRHLKKSKTSQVRHNCDKCFRNYSVISSLKRHYRLTHTADKPEFICDVCGYKACRKSHLLKHISSCHFKITKRSKASYNCNKCLCIYSSSRSLKRHDRLKHAADKPEYICDVSGYETSVKSSLSDHIYSLHFKKSKTSQGTYKCDKCFRSYCSVGALNKHNRLKHVSVKR